MDDRRLSIQDVGSLGELIAAIATSQAKPAFSEGFVAYVDGRLAGDEFPHIHPGLGGGSG